ncbi:MAG: S8 family serine peptidase [Bacteriovoracaceae bacterium]|nr:S8 family serine peptidase [Bacteriovoracaceae bacterium]
MLGQFFNKVLIASIVLGGLYIVLDDLDLSTIDQKVNNQVTQSTKTQRTRYYGDVAKTVKQQASLKKSIVKVNKKTTTKKRVKKSSIKVAKKAANQNRIVRRNKLRPKSRTKIVRRKEQNPSIYNISELYSPYTSWGISPLSGPSSINLVDAWKNFKKRKQVVVAIIDTGIDPKHPFLKNNIHVSEGAKNSKNYGVDFSKGKKYLSQPNDTHGHGTHVAGIIKSIFPDVKLLVLKYYNPDASGKENLNSTIEALRYAVESNVDVINYSGGGPEPSMEELRILKRAQAKGIIVVAAAGNEESNIDRKNNAYYPASYGLSNIITVTAHDQRLNILSSSNYGKRTVDISAPGHRIRSALPNTRVGYLTGTSQATAFASGVVALLKSQFPNLGPSQIKYILRNSATKNRKFAKKCISGGGLNASNAQKLAYNIVKTRDTRSSRHIATGSKLHKKVRKSSIIHAQQKPKGKIIYRIGASVNNRRSP